MNENIDKVEPSKQFVVIFVYFDSKLKLHNIFKVPPRLLSYFYFKGHAIQWKENGNNR